MRGRNFFRGGEVVRRLNKFFNVCVTLSYKKKFELLSLSIARLAPRDCYAIPLTQPKNVRESGGGHQWSIMPISASFLFWA